MRPAAIALVLFAGWLGVAAQQGTEQQREAGRALYDKYCAQCHGVAGDGAGPAAARVKPAPRDFTSGKYKLRTTPSGTLPTDDDIKRAIRYGLPYTSMPAWPNLSDDQLTNLVYYLKTFSQDFSNPDKAGDPIEIPRPPPLSPESVERGRTVYEQLGCEQCHGELGRGDGPSAATLVDDWGDHIRPADMTMRWTFRGGPTRTDIFRTFSTGLNGTPMPSYYDSVEEGDRWDLVDYIYSLGDGDDPGYDNLLRVVYIQRALDLSAGAELFDQAPAARFPLLGQIVQPGRNFYPSATAIDVQAVYNRSEIAFRLTWNDMRAETNGRNGPDLEVPTWQDQLHHQRSTGASPAEEAAEGFWGADAQEGGEEDFWGADAEGPEEEEFWGAEVEERGGEDFWGEQSDEQAGGAGTGAPDTEFSDAVAIQLPKALPTGNRKPYFIYGDAQSPVDLWFVDLASGLPEQYTGRGSELLERNDADIIAVASTYDKGQWSVIFKRSLRSTGGISVDAGQYVPIAFSVWDGFNRERGNKRSLTAWMYFYVEPTEQVSAVGPMLRAGLTVLFVEILVILIVRRRFAGRRIAAPHDFFAEQTVPRGGATG